MFKKFVLCLGMALMMICLLAACGGDDQTPTEPVAPSDKADAPAVDGAEDEFAEYDYYEWSLAHCASLTHARVVTFENFVDRVYEATNGHVKITLYGTGELPYTATEYVSVASSGVCEITDCSASNVSGEWKSVALPTFPFLCTNWDDFKTMIDTITPIIEQELNDEWNCRILMFNADPLQVLCGSGEPILSLSDMNTRKVRGQNAYVQQFLELAGASPITVTSNEIAEAMSHGIIDAFTTGAPTISSLKYYEYSDWLVDGALLCTNSFAVISNDVFDTLPEVFQEIILEQGKICGDESWEVAKTQHEEAIAQIKEAGIDIYTMDEAFMQEGYELIKDSWYEWAKAASPATVEALEATMEALY